MLAGICVDFSAARPCFKIRAEAEKGNRDRLLPITPDFAEMLEGVAHEQRQGRVFDLRACASGKPMGAHRIGIAIANIGKAAGVVVCDERKRHASAHDLRRSFGTRWASRVISRSKRR